VNSNNYKTIGHSPGKEANMKGKFYLIGILTALFFASIYSEVHSTPVTDCKAVIVTEFGPVKGAFLSSVDACVWAGIPYAAPPVGELRFKPPVDPEPWKDIRYATSFSPPCCQRDTRLDIGHPWRIGSLIGHEDCLYLNIWRPRSDADKLPVMVWIHGGSFLTGAGSLPLYQGYRLAAERNVMVVTINYRLGPMGFLAQRDLSAEDPHKSSGNYGILDQIKALEWVKRNIAAFGGDPDNVTIFGESAGGQSVFSLLASPLAKGLFNRAIIESGSHATLSMEEGFNYGDKLAKDLGCDKGHEIECLREKSADAIFSVVLWDETESGNSPFRPHIDGWALPEKPLDAFKSGNYNRVPVLAGTNRDEIKPLKYLDRKSRRMKREDAEKRYGKKFGDEAAKRIIELYPFDAFESPVDAYNAVTGDSRLGCAAYCAAEEMASTNNAIYIYRFDFDDHRFPKTGAFHLLEIPFIFDSFDKMPVKLIYKKENVKTAAPLAGAMRKYWTNFAATGNPNGDGLPNWPVFSAQSKQFILFDTAITTDTFKPDGRCAFWYDYASKH